MSNILCSFLLLVLPLRARHQAAGVDEPLLPTAPVPAVPRAQRLEAVGLFDAVARVDLRTCLPARSRHAQSESVVTDLWTRHSIGNTSGFSD